MDFLFSPDFARVGTTVAVLCAVGCVAAAGVAVLRRKRPRGLEIRVDGRQVRLAEGASDGDILATIRRLRGERP